MMVSLDAVNRYSNTRFGESLASNIGDTMKRLQR